MRLHSPVNFPLPSLSAAAAQARVLKQPPVNPLAHLPQVVAELRNEIRNLQQQISKLTQDAVTRAHREHRLARHLIADIDGRAAFWRKLGTRQSQATQRASVILTSQRATA